MTRRRFIADTWTGVPGNQAASTATLTGDQAFHLARVLRAERGQIYDIVANGFLHRAEITSVSPEQVTFALHEELEAYTALPVHLLLAIFKFDHMEWAIEKATELGVSSITPILARRTERHLTLAAPKRVERWRRIVLEASKQSRRTTIPEVADPTPLKAALEVEHSPTQILLSETEQNTTLTSALTLGHRPTGYEAVALSIGPEGGWTQEEIALFAQFHWTPITLGPRILRAETAAIAALAITAAHLSA